MPKITSTSAGFVSSVGRVGGRRGQCPRSSQIFLTARRCAPLMRAGRSCVNPAHVQSTTAFARSSPVGQQREVDRAPGERRRLALHRPAAPASASPPRRGRSSPSCPCRGSANGSVSLPATRRAMFSPARSPDCSATEPSCGQDLVRLRVGDPAMSPTTNTSGCPAALRSGPTGTRPPRSQLDAERAHERVRLQAGAPDERVGLEHLARLQRDPRRRRSTTTRSPSQHLDAALLERPLRVLADVRLEHREAAPGPPRPG